MPSLRNSSSSSNNGTKSSSLSQKKPSFLVRFIKGTFFQIFVFFTTIILLGVGYAAWTTLDRNDAANGKPVTQTLMQGIIDNINDLNTRLSAINPSGTKISGSEVCISGDCKTAWPNAGGTLPPSTLTTTCDTTHSGSLSWGISSSPVYGCPPGHNTGTWGACDVDATTTVVGTTVSINKFQCNYVYGCTRRVLMTCQTYGYFYTWTDLGAI